MRILLVENDAILAGTLKDLLAGRGYLVEAQLNGKLGLAAAMEQDFSLIVLDVKLPEIDGLDVCRRVRQAGIRVPILILTEIRNTLGKVQAFQCGADDCVSKPFEPAELLARIGALIRRASLWAPGNQLTLDLQGKRIDFDRSQLMVNGIAIDLSDIEFRLLRYLVEHKSEVVTRDKLLRDVWGYEAMPDSRTITVHISRLRQKLEDDPHNPRHILTVHGHGYRFSA